MEEEWNELLMNSDSDENMELGNCEFVSCKNEASSSSGNESENDIFNC